MPKAQRVTQVGEHTPLRSTPFCSVFVDADDHGRADIRSESEEVVSTTRAHFANPAGNASSSGNHPCFGGPRTAPASIPLHHYATSSLATGNAPTSISRKAFAASSRDCCDGAAGIPASPVARPTPSSPKHRAAGPRSAKSLNSAKHHHPAGVPTPQGQREQSWSAPRKAHSIRADQAQTSVPQDPVNNWYTDCASPDSWQLAGRGLRSYGPRIDTLRSLDDSNSKLIDDRHARRASSSTQRHRIRRDPNSVTQSFARTVTDGNLPGKETPSLRLSDLRGRDFVASPTTTTTTTPHLGLRESGQQGSDTDTCSTSSAYQVLPCPVSCVYSLRYYPNDLLIN